MLSDDAVTQAGADWRGWEHSVTTPEHSLDVFLPHGRTIRFLSFANEHRSWGLVSRYLASPHNSGSLGTGDTRLDGWEVVATSLPNEEVGNHKGVT